MNTNKMKSLREEAQDAVDSIELLRSNAGDETTLQNIIWAAIVLRGLYVAQRIEPLDEAGSESLQKKLTSLAAKDGAGMNQSSVLHAFTMLTLNVAGDVLKAADLADAGTTHA